ncbi:MAG: hypothetical protein CM1200mP39_01440 [Dehalococcoidia bacterium]|nr:MAG: hypothetical protein CM1200mP39_01440 [Dehalococcoidia bacterium]
MGTVKCVVASTITLLVSIAILSLGGVLGTDPGVLRHDNFSNWIFHRLFIRCWGGDSPTTHRSPLWPVTSALLFGVVIIGVSYLLAVDAGKEWLKSWVYLWQ